MIAAAKKKQYPLAVDLDGTLVRTDTLLELVLLFLKRNPLRLLIILYWLRRGKAFMKDQLSRRVSCDVALLPYHQPLLRYLMRERARGRRVYLVTAAHLLLAERIAAHLGIFSGVVATDGTRNMAGVQKAQALRIKFGRRAFIYAGNAGVDLPVWREAAAGIVVSSNPRLRRRAGRVTRVISTFGGTAISWRALDGLLRVYQWTKNFLLFVPLLAAHRAAEAGLLRQAVIAFLAFCCASSAAYIINDLLDLESDRQHPRKKDRPLASGSVPLLVGLAVPPVLLAASAILAWLVSPLVLGIIGAYIVLTLLYSLVLKQLVLIDVFTLAGLYLIRILAGAAAVTVPISSWLAAFALFFFLSLALVKRFAELLRLQGRRAAGRGYVAADANAIAHLGTASAYVSALVLALYINSSEVAALYTVPAALWLVVPLFVFWVSRIWFLAYRSNLEDDPLIFAIRDPISYGVGLGVVAIALFAL